MNNLQHIRMRMANKGRGTFRAEAKADGAAVLWLYDAIASSDEEAYWMGGVSPERFIAELRAIDAPVTLRINSPGGSVFGAQAMVAAMREHPHPITARVDALAASAASVIAAECARCEVVEGAFLMIHKAWGLAVGNEDDLRQLADLLSQMDGQIAATYARRAKLGEAEEWLDLMRAETWFTASEAVVRGLADVAITESTQRGPAARWDLTAFSAAPAPQIGTWAPELVDGPAEPAAQAAPDMAAMRRRTAARIRQTVI